MDDLYERQKRYYDLRAAEYDAGAWDAASDEHARGGRRSYGGRACASSGTNARRRLRHGVSLPSTCAASLTALDASADMLELAAKRVPDATLVVGEALSLPFADASFGRVFSSFFYDHLRPAERRAFLAEARRVADELVLVQQTGGPEHWEGVERRRCATARSTRSTRCSSQPNPYLPSWTGARWFMRMMSSSSCGAPGPSRT